VAAGAMNSTTIIGALCEGLIEVVVLGLGKHNESPKQRARAIARETGLRLGARDPKWLLPDRGKEYKDSNLPLIFTLVGTTCPVAVVDQGKRQHVYEYKRTEDRAYCADALGRIILMREAPRYLALWEPRPDEDAGACWNCGALGHWERTCNGNPARPECEICGWLGHWKQRCPNKRWRQ